MTKYKYEKFQIKSGRKSYILSQHDGEKWGGPVIEHFAKENATKLGIYSDERKYLFELAILNPEGKEYTVKACKDGYPNGPTIVMINDTLYFGRYYARDGFNGIVYRFRQGERVRIQEYKHGVLIDECINDYVMYENVATPLPFDCNYESMDVVERKKTMKDTVYMQYVAGDPTESICVLAAEVDPADNIKLGQFSRNAFNGFVLDYSSENNTTTFAYYDNGKPVDDWKLVYLPDVGGYALVLKKENGGFTDIVYCEKDKKNVLTILELDAKEVPIKGKSLELPTKIDPDAEKPSVGEVKKHAPKKDAKGLTAMQRLNNMIGLTNIKEEITKLKAILAKSPNKTPSLNMAFYGNAGTGKTEVARLFAEILYDEGILETSKFVETDRSGLVGEYIGATAPKTHAIVESAVGGVLFIDEAYTLKPDSEKDLGHEALAALLVDMEKYRGKMCFIFAGYKQPLMDMFESNKGLKSRINRYFEFKNYTQDELKEIAKRRVQSDGYIMSEEVLDETIKIVSKRMYADDFGNAREVRNVLEKLYEYQAARTVSTNKRDMVITLADIDAYNKKDDPEKVNNLTALERLEKLIGLSNVKKEILKLKAVLAKNKDAVDKTNLHMCFYGNPGTGKTEVARLLANILYDEGILPENKFIETDRSGLVAGYVGQTAIKTHKVIKDALGGVLFIDEAYSLNSSAEGDYGAEAIDALVADMENYRGKFCVILAGYEKPMEEMLAINPGFKSRINRNIVFPDYTDEELKEITKSMLKANKYSITDEALDEIGKVIESVRANPDFANARTVRNILESIYEIQALRTYLDGISDNWLIKRCDVLEYEKDHNISFKQIKAEKHDFGIKTEDFVALAENYNEDSYVFNTDLIEQVSVNIKNEKDGKTIGEGSGFFISPKGIIATCAHVVKGAEKLTVIVNFKTVGNQYLTKDYTAEVISFNEESDVALIGILGSDLNFAYYPLAKKDAAFPKLMTDIVMGGYPFGGDRFETITITEGKVQSINKDSYSENDRVNMYVDLSGHPGSSGSGVIDKASGRCVGVFAGAAIGSSGSVKLTINYAVPVQYLWELIDNTHFEESTINDLYEEDEIEAVVNEEVPANQSQVRRDEMLMEERRENRFIHPTYDNIHIVRGDVSTFRGDAVVNAANQKLAPGSGVCGAIFKGAGYNTLLKECQSIGGCPVGNAVITKGFNLPAKYIIHAVGPNYEVDRNPERLLANVYASCFDIALRYQIKTIAFPSISTGIFKFPKDLAAPIALKEIFKRAAYMNEIYVYCFDDETYEIYRTVYERMKNNMR